MSRSKAIAIAFYLGAVVVGAAIGIAVDRSFMRSRLDGIASDPRQRFFDDLRLTPAQRTAWDSIRTATIRADSALMAPITMQAMPFRPQRDSIFKAMEAAHRALLTPEQQKL